MTPSTREAQILQAILHLSKALPIDQHVTRRGVQQHTGIASADDVDDGIRSLQARGLVLGTDEYVFLTPAGEAFEEPRRT